MWGSCLDPDLLVLVCARKKTKYDDKSFKLRGEAGGGFNRRTAHDNVWILLFLQYLLILVFLTAFVGIWARAA
jgi:hypothetical protein